MFIPQKQLLNEINYESRYSIALRHAVKLSVHFIESNKKTKHEHS